jgi:hypothetical protein
VQEFDTHLDQRALSRLRTRGFNKQHDGRDLALERGVVLTGSQLLCAGEVEAVVAHKARDGVEDYDLVTRDVNRCGPNLVGLERAYRRRDGSADLCEFIAR